MHRKTFVAACAATSLIGIARVNALAAESDYNLETSTGTIFGTLMLPDHRSATVPVVLIVAGSGPTDRNGNGPTLSLNTYGKIASALAAKGIASVRYDKRGIAASHAAMASENDIRFDTYIDDAAAWIARLRADKRFSRAVLAGHSEGSLVGMVAAQRAPVDAYVSLEGAGFPAADVLRTQLQPQLAPYPKLAAQAESALTAISAGKTIPAADVPPELMSLLRPSVQPYLISWFKYDPRVEIAKLNRGVTIVQGTHDVQVPVADGRALAAANTSATYVAIDGMTHVLADDPAATLDGQLRGAYVDTMRPLDTTLVQTLVSIATAN
jgi:pimeloyl-ACP methyl ester carboxylesterase